MVVFVPVTKTRRATNDAAGKNRRRMSIVDKKAGKSTIGGAAVEPRLVETVGSLKWGFDLVYCRIFIKLSS